MHRSIIITGFLLFILSGSFAQDNKFPKKINASLETNIDKLLLKDAVEYFASEECAGRETASDGIEAAREYIKERLMQYGLEPAFLEGDDGYSQELPLIEKQFAGAEFALAEKGMSFLDHYYYYSNIPTRGVRADEIVFVGYGLDEKKYSDYSGKILENKAVIISNREMSKKFKRLFPKERREKSASFANRLNYLKKFNPAVILVLDDNYTNSVRRVADYMSHKRLSLESTRAQENDEDEIVVPVYYVNPEIMNERLGIDLSSNLKFKNRKKRTSDISLPFYAKPEIIEKPVSCANVGGMIRGEDFPEEVIVLSAHYDHLGMGRDGEIYNGADDNASGSAAILSIAENLATRANMGERPMRSVMFVWFSGEEKGLLGSRYFVNSPPMPLNNIKANLNVDMIGRVDEPHEKAGVDNYIYIIGSDRLSSTLHQLNEDAGQEAEINLDYTFNDENDPNQFYRRSDHFNFAKNGIPVIFYFSGVHKDYHKTTDTAEKLNHPKIIRATELILKTTEKLINSHEPIEVDKP